MYTSGPQATLPPRICPPSPPVACRLKADTRSCLCDLLPVVLGHTAMSSPNGFACARTYQTACSPIPAPSAGASLSSRRSIKCVAGPLHGAWKNPVSSYHRCTLVVTPAETRTPCCATSEKQIARRSLTRSRSEVGPNHVCFNFPVQTLDEFYSSVELLNLTSLHYRACL